MPSEPSAGFLTDNSRGTLPKVPKSPEPHSGRTFPPGAVKGGHLRQVLWLPVGDGSYGADRIDDACWGSDGAHEQ